MNPKRLFLAYFFLAFFWAIFSDLYLPLLMSKNLIHIIHQHHYQAIGDVLFLAISVGIVYFLVRRDIENRQQLTAQIIKAQDMERNRISRELHDDLGQSVVTLKLELARNDPKIQDQILEDIDGIVEKIRSISQNLSPSISDNVGLASELREMFGRFDKNNCKIVTNNLDLINNCFSPESSLSIFRVFQEILTNIIKHANASLVKISVERGKDHLLFMVKDDGKGFDAKEISPGIGLASIKERIASLKGKIKISSQKGKGTIITFQVPIENY
jgi:signal transduction histidine kinase